MEPLANDLGCAPNPEQRMVEIDRNTFEEFQNIAKCTNTNVKTVINTALIQWLRHA
jgi:ATP-dependent Zn protease